MNPTQLALRRLWRRTSRYRPRTMTGAIIAVTVAAFLVEIVAPGPVVGALGYAAAYSIPSTGAPFEPWRMLTVLLVHAPITGSGGSIINITHILFNMYALYVFGGPLEAVIGARRLLAVYVISGFGGSVAVLYASLTNLLGSGNLYVVGASGAVFGLLAATIVIQRRFGGNIQGLVILVVINLALDFYLQGIAWQAHVGGLIVGAAAGWLVVRNRGPRRVRQQIGGLSVLSVVLIVLALAPTVAA